MFYILGLIVLAVVIGGMTYFFSGKTSKEEEVPERPDDCCGAHEVCESDSLLSSGNKAEYYEDEELDRFQNIAPNNFLDNEIEEFREVLMTLKDREVAGWLKSLQLRNINPPEIIREEALMIVADRRNAG